MSASDNYEVYYGDKLWNLLPAIYRTLDTDDFNATGPLRELVNRIGVQAAILRRSIDRMWEDQSIETCDDWIIPYIGDLLGTRLVPALDPQGQRLDVAKTIYFRQRKGTLAILEEIASRITRWDAKVVEFFRRLGRTRHGLDPAIGLAFAADDAVANLQLAEGLVAKRSRTMIGGFADLRIAAAASQAHTAFDEFFHTADMRQGFGSTGWYNIPHLGVFLWRLGSFPVGPVTPVSVAGCPACYSFDPTGRDIPLFAASRASNQFGDNWVTPAEGQLPGPIPQSLLDADLRAGAKGLQLYPRVLSVAQLFESPPGQQTVPAAELSLRPERGRFAYHGSPPQSAGADLVCFYHYGFPSEIGAGPYDRLSAQLHAPVPGPDAGFPGSGPLSIPPSGTLTLNHSLTYAGAKDVAVSGKLVLQAGNHQRPVIRFPAGQCWTFNGSPGSTLVLDGLMVSGADVVLQGTFDSVSFSCCTLDPGSAAPRISTAETSLSPPAAVFSVAVDGRELVPTRVWIEGTITTLALDRCVTGPIRTRGSGAVATLKLSNSVIQGIRTSGFGPLELADVKDRARFERLLQLGLDPVSALLQAFAPEIVGLLGGGASPPLAAPPPSDGVLPGVLDALSGLLAGPPLWDSRAFARVPLSAETARLLSLADLRTPAPALNRLLLEDAYPLELADAALALADGNVKLSRCTILGRVIVHRLDASECILQQLAQVDDVQSGCVRLSAWADGSLLPRQYESVRVAQEAPLFTTTDFGQPGYAQLLPLVDGQILPPSTQDVRLNTISAGAEDGSEMGAYARDKNPIKQRALQLKFLEYMPAGLIPVIVPVT
jgi:hypothetical protein